MFKRWNNKGVVMVMVLGTILVVVILANVILTIILNQTRLTRHQIDRIRAYYAATAAMNYTIEMLRAGTWPLPVGANVYACLNGCVDLVTPAHTIPADTDIPYSVQVTIHPSGSGPQGTAQLDIKTEYTYNL